jgi:hypothetical protein
MRPTWVTRQIAHLVRQFSRFGGPGGLAWAPWIGIADRSGFEGRRTDDMPPRFFGRLESFPELPIHEGFVWSPDDPEALPELWLAPTKTGYRRVFERFAQRHLGAPGLEGANVQIDHVFPKKAGSLGGLAYVRMLAIPPESNMAAGRTLERAMVARNEELGPRGKKTRMATYFAIGKATGFTAYEAMPDEEGSAVNAALAKALLAHLRAFGLPPDVLTPLDQKLTTDRLRDFR